MTIGSQKTNRKNRGGNLKKQNFDRMKAGMVMYIGRE
jgi:hypothetical protein